MGAPERTKDFKHIYSNAFGLQMNENEVMVDFGIYEDVSKPESSVLQQVRIVLSPRGTKLLGLTLAKVISDWEKATGIEISIAPEKIAQLQTAMVTKKTE